MDAIFNRRSIREYKNKNIKIDIAEYLIKAGMHAPSAGDQRPWQFIIINNDRLNMPQHPEIELTVKLDSVTGNHENDRNALRTLLLDSLVEEKAGTGKGEYTSKYRYNVEFLSCGNKIYLTRPVPLNKGFDFIIHVENYTFKLRSIR